MKDASVPDLNNDNWVVKIKDLRHFGSAVQAPVAVRVVPGRTNISSFLKIFFARAYSTLTRNRWTFMDIDIETLFWYACANREFFGCNVPELDSISLDDFEYIF